MSLAGMVFVASIIHLEASKMTSEDLERSSSDILSPSLTWLPFHGWIPFSLCPHLCWLQLCLIPFVLASSASFSASPFFGWQLPLSPSHQLSSTFTALVAFALLLFFSHSESHAPHSLPSSDSHDHYHKKSAVIWGCFTAPQNAIQTAGGGCNACTYAGITIWGLNPPPTHTIFFWKSGGSTWTAETSVRVSGGFVHIFFLNTQMVPIPAYFLSIRSSHNIDKPILRCVTLSGNIQRSYIELYYISYIMKKTLNITFCSRNICLNLIIFTLDISNCNWSTALQISSFKQLQAISNIVSFIS